MKKQTIIALVFIILVGVLLGSVVYFGLSTGTEQVVVPAIDIKAGQTFTADNLKIITIPKAINLEGVMYKEPQDILGKTAISSLVAGEPITTSKISATPSDSFLQNMEDPVKDYTMTFAIPSDRPLRSLVAGDYVTVFATYTDKMENIVTGQVGGKYKVVDTDEDEEGNIFAITIEVNPENMAELSHTVMNATYMVTYVTAEHEVQDVPGVSHQQIVDKHLGTVGTVAPVIEAQP